MRYTPKADTALVRRWIYLLMGVGTVAFLVTAMFPTGRALLQAAGVLFFAAGLFLTARYVLTSFTYALVPKGTGDGEAMAFAGPADVRYLPLSSVDFTVHRQRGRGVPVLEACLSLSDLTDFQLLPRNKEERRRILSMHPLVRTYHYTVSFRRSQRYLAVFADGEAEIGILFEPGDEMTAVFREAARRNQTE